MCVCECNVLVREATREGVGHGFEPCKPRSAQLNGDKRVAGRWVLLDLKKNFLTVYFQPILKLNFA
jgi:hypothetical protein